MATDDTDRDTQDPLVSAKLAQILANAPILFDRLGATARAGIAPGSPAAEDANFATRASHSDHGHRPSRNWPGASRDLAQAPDRRIAAIRHPHDPDPWCHGGAVTCRWLLDPRQDSAERVRRGVALLLDDYGNRRDFERDFGIDPAAIKPPAMSGTDRYKELQEERAAAGIGRVKVETMTYRFGGYAGLQPGPGRAIYRLLSAYAHGKQWKGLTTKIQAIEAAAEVRGGKVVKVTANDDMSVMLTGLAMKVAALAVDEVDAYCGVAGAA
jgi:hypothetical protein